MSYIQVYPSSADKFFKSVVDGNSPSGFGFEEQTIPEIKADLGIEPTYPIIQEFVGNGTTIWNNNPTLFTNDVPGTTIDSDWTKIGTGQFSKDLSGTGLTSSSFSSKKIKRGGVIFDINSIAVIGFYQTYVSWTGSVWRLDLFTFDLTGAFANLNFSTSPHLIETGLNIKEL